MDKSVFQATNLFLMRQVAVDGLEDLASLGFPEEKGAVRDPLGQVGNFVLEVFVFVDVIFWIL